MQCYYILTAYPVKHPKDTAVHSKNPAVIPVKLLQAGWVTALHQVLPKAWLSMEGVGRPHRNVFLLSICCVSRAICTLYCFQNYSEEKKRKMFHLILKKKKGWNWCKQKQILKEMCIWIKTRQFFKAALALICIWWANLNNLSSRFVPSYENGGRTGRLLRDGTLSLFPGNIVLAS